MEKIQNLIVFLALIVTDTTSLPTTLLEDTKELQDHGNSNKVKRAEEIIMFGNQQNRPMSTAGFYQSPAKRDINGDEVGLFTTTAIPIEDYVVDDRLSKIGEGSSKTVADYEKGYRYGVGKDDLDKQAENALLKSEVLGEPASVNQYRYYGGGNEHRGRTERVYTSPSKRSAFRSTYPLSNGLHRGAARMKRDLDLDIDPEDVLAILSLWEAERRKNYPYRHEVSKWPHYNNYINQANFDEQSDNEIGDGNDDSDDEDDENDNNGENKGWLEGPVIPSSSTNYAVHYGPEKRRYYYPVINNQYPIYPVRKRESQWGGFAKNKRFMVTRKRMVDGPHDNIHSLAQLLNSTPHRNPGIPVYHRLLL